MFHRPSGHSQIQVLADLLVLMAMRFDFKAFVKLVLINCPRDCTITHIALHGDFLEFVLVATHHPALPPRKLVTTQCHQRLHTFFHAQQAELHIRCELQRALHPPIIIATLSVSCSTLS